VHNRRCRNLARLLRDGAENDRLLEAHWNSAGPVSRKVTLRMEAFDRTGLLNDITNAINKHGLFIYECDTKSDERRGTAAFRYIFQVTNVEALDAVIADLRLVRGVYKVERVARVT
jgi:GTP pyrophosphokinase